MKLLDHVKAAGFPYPDFVVHLFVGGSALHGAKVQGYDDLDIYGVYVEPPQKILGLDDLPHFVWSTAGDDRKNSADDVDITLYGLRKWAGLACKGNPSVLHFLFSESDLAPSPNAELWQRGVLEHRGAFLCRGHLRQFVGFAENQLQRMKGERGRNVVRHDLVEKYGYDTKFAMHCVRLLVECEELMREGRITLPSPEKDLLIAIRTGQFSHKWVMEEAERRITVCEHAAQTSPLPVEVDRERISSIIAGMYREHWGMTEGKR